MPVEEKTVTRTREAEFIRWLQGLNEEQEGREGKKRPKERAVLATLRRGLGKAPGTAIEMYPYLMPFGPWESEWEMKSYFMVAALFASHPAPGGTGSMGSTMAAVKSATGSESIEKRFVALLNAHPDDLYRHLRHAVSLAKSKEIPVNWGQLLRDIKDWPSTTGIVQRRWARDFWTGEAPAEAIGATEINNEQEEE